MKTPVEHRVYLAKQDYPLRCSAEVFENDELNLLSRYGFWIEALVDGVILPITDYQKRLMDVHSGKVEPINLQELAWRKLIERKTWEKNERESPHYKLIDESEQWLGRSDRKKMRNWKSLQ
jgi:uncharacterized protein YifE (UPF0438 family)